MKDLAYIGKVVNKFQISGAEKIESLEVVCGEGGKWMGCSQIGTLNIGDTCVVFLQDSILPEWPEFEFMKKHKYRVKMHKFLGTPSEVLIMPVKAFQKLVEYFSVGDNATEFFQVTKYSKSIPLSMQGECQGNFPSFIPKTDEPNFQSVTGLVNYMKEKLCYTTLKYDGTSCTMYKKDDEFGVCSRNLEKKNTEKCIYWNMAKKYNIENILPDNHAIQMEIIGPGIQKNRCGLKELEIRVFNMFDINEQKYLSILDWKPKLSNIPFAMTLEIGIFEAENNAEIRESAEVFYENGNVAEGIVVRTIEEDKYHGMRCSFKVINLNYKGN